MIRGVIYDLDGTLYSSMAAVLRTYSEITGIPVNVLEKTYDPDWKKFERENNVPRISSKKWNEIFMKQSFDSKLFPGAIEHLRKIRNKGYKIALATSGGITKVEYAFAGYDLHNIFEVITTVDVVKEIKPDPKSLIVTAEKLGLDTKECIFIGDTNVDALAAKNAGMKFIGVGWKGAYHPPEVIKGVNKDTIVESFDELYATITKIE